MTARALPFATAPFVRAAVCCVALLGTATGEARAQAQAYKVKVEISGVEGAARRNVLAVLAIARAARSGDLPLERVRQLNRGAEDEIATALEPFGYYRPLVQKQLRQDGKTWLASYVIAPGPAVRIRQVNLSVAGEGADSPTFRKIVAEFPLQQGDTLRHLPYEAWKIAVLTAASDSGYLKAAFDTSAVMVDRENGVADVLLRIDTGPRYRFGPVTFHQDVLNPKFLRTRIPFREGELFQQRKLLELQSNLGEDPYFSLVEVMAEPDSAQGLEVPIRVDLGFRKPQAFEVGAGYGTDNGPRGRAAATLRRLNARGHHAQVEVIGSANEQSVSTKYMIPAFGNPTGVLTLLAGYALLNPTTSRSTTWLIGPRLSRRRLGWRETINLAYQRENFGVGVDSGIAKMVLAGVAWERTRANDRTYPTRGLRVRLNAQGATKSFGSNVSFLQLSANAKAIRGLGPRFRMLVRGDIGRDLTGNFRALPPTMRFFAGGDQSVRGYQYLTLGERDILGNVIGGPTLLAGSVEADYRFMERFAFAVFTDAGNAMEKLTLGDLQQGAGVGIRWLSPIGLIRVDGAWAVSRAGTPFRLHFSLGPDL
ncbi:MAG: outer membrane protein assembly factor [Gemmatimonadales bacterium]|nr:outer membrane protein assembly factor [Gemmatimonadales bacterium]